MPTVSAAALAAMAVMPAGPTVATLTAVTVMEVLRAFAPVTLIARAMAVVMLIMFSHMFHLLSSRLSLSPPSRTSALHSLRERKQSLPNLKMGLIVAQETLQPFPGAANVHSPGVQIVDPLVGDLVHPPGRAAPLRVP